MAIGKYGDGHLYMITPHPSITLDNSGHIIREETMGAHARRRGWSKEQFEGSAVSLRQREGTPVKEERSNGWRFWMSR